MTRVIIIFLSLMLAACASSSETSTDSAESEDSQEVYVFDDMTEETDETESAAEIAATSRAQNAEEPEVPESSMEKAVEFYIVQVGAFSTESRANTFVSENKDKISYNMSIHYSDDVKLYVVQLPPFRTREEAEEVRNALWDTGRYNDAFIVPR